VREEWEGINLTGDPSPSMLVGWREPRRRLDALRVVLHKDVFGELADLCQPALDKVQSYEERPFETFAALDSDQYFWHEHASLPQLPSRGEAPTPDDNVADLVRLVKGVDALEDATRNDLANRKLSFYAICWRHRDSVVGFVSRTDPVATLKPGVRFFQYGNTMRTVGRPDFALKEGADLVVGIEGTAILTEFAFQTLFAGVAFENVQRDMASVRQALAGTIPLTPGADEALLAEVSRTRSMALHLRELPGRLEIIDLDIESLRKSLDAHDIDADLILDEDGCFSFERQNVPTFFDAIECRYFEDDLGGGHRRADRFSAR